jgi:hypothetical protein
MVVDASTGQCVASSSGGGGMTGGGGTTGGETARKKKKKSNAGVIAGAVIAAVVVVAAAVGGAVYWKRTRGKGKHGDKKATGLPVHSGGQPGTDKAPGWTSNPLPAAVAVRPSMLCELLGR